MISLFFSVWMSISQASTPEMSHKLKQAIMGELPTRVSPSVSGIRFDAPVPRTARIQILGPHPPLGMISFQAVWRERDRMKRVFGSALVAAAAKIAVTKVPIRPGEAFTASNVTFEERELQPLSNSGYWIEGADLFDRKSRGYLPPGSIIGAGQAIVPAAVEAGQIVDLILERAGLKLTAKVKSLEMGSLDQWIRVENARTKKKLVARVSAPGEVRLK